MNETQSGKKYLTLWNKIGYGLGDGASMIPYQIIASFLMLFYSSYVGLDPAIIGSLMMVAKLFDGVTDVIFGFIMDKTHSKMGKARPWVFYGMFGVEVTFIAMFISPHLTSVTAQYAWFFIFYTLHNAVFYTMTTNSYSSLVYLITRNNSERLQLGSFRYCTTMIFGTVLTMVSLGFVKHMGGGTKGWLIVVCVYSVIALIVNAISVYSVRELPEERAEGNHAADSQKDKLSFGKGLSILLTNRYFILIVAMYIALYLSGSVTATVNVFYTTYVLESDAVFGMLNIAYNIPMIAAIVLMPFMTKMFGSIRKTNVICCILSIPACVLMSVCAYQKLVPGILAGLAVRSFANGAVIVSMGTLVSMTCDNVFRTKKVHIDGMIFSSTGIGIKVGGGVGTALAGFLLSAGGFISSTSGTAITQPESALKMITFIFGVVPLFIFLLLLVTCLLMDVEKKNEELLAEQA